MARIPNLYVATEHNRSGGSSSDDTVRTRPLPSPAPVGNLDLLCARGQRRRRARSRSVYSPLSQGRADLGYPLFDHLQVHREADPVVVPGHQLQPLEFRLKLVRGRHGRHLLEVVRETRIQ